MLLALVVLVAILIAGAALFLLGTTGTSYGTGGTGGGSGSGSSPTTGQLEVNLPGPVWAVLFLSPLLLGLGAMIYRRLTNPGVSGYGLLLMVILAGILLLALLHLGTAGPGSVTIGVGPTNGNNSTNQSTNNSSHGGGGGGGGGTPGAIAPINIEIPSWALWLVGVVVCGGVLLFGIPAVASRLLDRTPRVGLGGGALPDKGELADVVGQAADALERGADPRETIVRLYLQLLLRLSLVAGTMASETPEEIRLNHLVPLGVPAPVAAAMTRIFEEARYSTHPIGPSSVAAAQEAMRATEAALRARESSAT